MNVLHVNNTDLMGKRFNGYDLLQDLKSRGVTGKQVVLDKTSDSPDVIHLLATPEDRALHQACAVAEQRHSMSNLLFPWGAFLTEIDEFKSADVVHLHLIHNNMISLTDLPRIVSLKPCVWTLHDPWFMTGHCIYPRQCKKWLRGCVGCPALDAIFPMADDCADSMWDVKRRALAELDADIVVASEFMLDMVQRSPLTSHFDRVHLIPFGVEPSVFLPDDHKAESRRALGIPENDFAMLFRSTTSEYKGLRYIVEALASAPPARSTTLLTVNEQGLVQMLANDYNILEFGWVHDDALLARIYSACDVMLMPSTAEAFGLMALEAMAAGRPVISFDGTSLPGVTGAPDCGVVVPMEDATALRSAIDMLARDPAEAQRRGLLGRAVAAEQFSHDRYLDSMASLYQEVLERSRSADPAGGVVAVPSRQLSTADSIDDAADGSVATCDANAATGPLAGARICMVFEFSLRQHTRFLREISALQEAGASVRLLTSHPHVEDMPRGLPVTVAPLLMPSVRTVGEPPNPLRETVLRQLMPEVDLFWVSDYLSLPTVLRVTKGSCVRVLYETVDLVPEYPHWGEDNRLRMLRHEEEIIAGVDGFITACDSYADYYMERYGKSVLNRRPVVSDNAPAHAVPQPSPTSHPRRLLFLGHLMFDRPVLELIDAMALAPGDVTLTFIGRNDLGRAPSARIEKHRLADRVFLLGPCPPGEVVEAASAYDVGIVALRGADENERRACTSKLFTYMSSGLAILGSDLPGIASVVNEHRNGLLVKGMDPGSWADAIATMVSKSSSEIDELKQRSLDAAGQYSWERQRVAFIAEFVRALGRSAE